MQRSSSPDWFLHTAVISLVFKNRSFCPSNHFPSLALLLILYAKLLFYKNRKDGNSLLSVIPLANHDLCPWRPCSRKDCFFSYSGPRAKLYVGETNTHIGKGIRSSKMVHNSEALKAELSHWKFLDSWTGIVPWKKRSTSLWGSPKTHQILVGEVFSKREMDLWDLEITGPTMKNDSLYQ